MATAIIYKIASPMSRMTGAKIGRKCFVGIKKRGGFKVCLMCLMD